MRQCIKPRALAIATLLLATSAATWAFASVTQKGSFYAVEVTTATDDGGDVVATIEASGRGGYHCNTLYPWKLTVEAPDGVQLSKKKFRKNDASQFGESKVVFRVPYRTSGRAGQIRAELKMSFCDEKQCQMKTLDLSWPAG
ncbi:MAG: hypothetical protein R6V85_02180 [Polyangia bacterium]